MMRKLAFRLTTLALLLVVLEGIAWIASMLVDPDDLFDHREGVLERLDAADLAAFVKTSGDPVLGWENRGPAVRQEPNCLGRLETYTFDEAGARTYTGFDPEAAEIVVVGDSYTEGAEVGDDETYPARLATLLKTSVANHGVGGHGPTQAFLDLKRKMELYPAARVVILAIQYENLSRMVNAYRPVLYDTSSTYTLKPFMAVGKIRPHPGEAALADIDSFRRHASQAFDTDFWAKPKAVFPYAIAIPRALHSNYFYLRRLQKALRRLGLPEYMLLFQSAEIRLNLIALLREYTEFALEQGVQPVVVFIPRNHYDTQSASRLIEENGPLLRPPLLVGDVGAAADMDWMRFNLKDDESGDTCHPSAYGQRKIAEYLAGSLLSAGFQWDQDAAAVVGGASARDPDRGHQPCGTGS